MLVEISVGLLILWLIGIPVFAWGISEFIKDDPNVMEAFKMNAEMNPAGMLVLSALVVFWPLVLLVRVVTKR